LSTFLTILGWFAIPFSIVAIIGWAATFASTLATIYLVALHWRLRRRGLEEERRLLATPLPPDDELPHVVVQIPAYNEGAIVARALMRPSRWIGRAPSCISRFSTIPPTAQPPLPSGRQRNAGPSASISASSTASTAPNTRPARSPTP
jgi:hypothetical protein